MVRACPHTSHHNECRAFSLSQDTALLSDSATYDQQQQEMFTTNLMDLDWRDSCKNMKTSCLINMSLLSVVVN